MRWDPAQYAKFGDERSRPFFDLTSRIRHDAPDGVVDLGCGPGDLTATLAQRWPEATVRGIDSSPEMIDRAQERAMPGRLSFEVGDAQLWKPDVPPDVIVSNALLHWIPDHLDLLPAWMDSLAPGGTLAFQVPGNFDAPSHRLPAEVAASPRWRERLAAAAHAPAASHDPAVYLEALEGEGVEVEAWETTYIQVLHGEDAVLEWVKGTALRPVVSLLDGAERDEFLAECAERLREAYPRRPFGTVFPFRRIFCVARRR